MMAQQMQQMQQQQLAMQKQMLAAMAALQKNAAPEAPTTPAFLTPVLPKEKKPAQPQQQVSPQRRSPRLKGPSQKVSPLRRSPRLVKVKNEEKATAGKTLKRTLSWSDAFKNSKRMKKPASVQKLRKRIGLKLGELDDQLMRGDFHELSNKTKTGLKFDRDSFFDTVAPIVWDLTGTPEDGDEEMSGKCLEMARDIMRKKFQYQADFSAVIKAKRQGKKKQQRKKTQTHQKKEPNGQNANWSSCHPKTTTSSKLTLTLCSESQFLTGAWPAQSL